MKDQAEVNNRLLTFYLTIKISFRFPYCGRGLFLNLSEAIRGHVIINGPVQNQVPDAVIG